MGCVVNGPGEAREADIGIAGGKGEGIIFKKGEIIRKINEKNILVEPLKGEIERNSASKIYVSTDVISGNPVPELKKGDEVRIIYNGEIMETYPAQIADVFTIIRIK